MNGAELIGAVEAIASMKRASERIQAETSKTIKELTFRLAGNVKSQKLSDQVLRVRTGRLRRSITARVNMDGASTVGTVGTNVSYAAAHEFGFKGTVTVRSYMRTAKSVFGRQLRSPITFPVGAHSRAVNIPERSFLRSALADMASEIPAGIGAAVKRATADA